MKTKNLILVIVAFVFATNILATETPQMKVVPMDGAKLLIAFNQHTPAVNQITIYSESGEMMHDQRLKKVTACYKQVFDLSKVKNGNYVVRLTYGKATLKKTIKVNNGKVTVVKEKAERPPFYSEVSNGLNLTYLNYEKNDVFIFVYNGNQLIKTAKLGSDFTICKRINLAALEKGKYDILLASAEKDYWFSVYR